jgi:hypothetical protein
MFGWAFENEKPHYWLEREKHQRWLREQDLPLDELWGVGKRLQDLRQKADGMAGEDFELFWGDLEMELGQDITNIIDSAPTADFLHYHQKEEPYASFLADAENILNAVDKAIQANL